MEAGVRVLRGPDWNLSDEDGGDGHVGTVTGQAGDGNVKVVWDGGQSSTCRGGLNQGAHDLRVLDNGTVGIRHLQIVCHECKESGILGIRWKCAECDGIDLCSLCYFKDCHNCNHHFWRIETPDSPHEKVEPRLKSMKRRVLGIFPGASVVRGAHWEGGTKMVCGKDNSGQVVKVFTPAAHSARSLVQVKWENGFQNDYRLGYKGKVDLQYKEEAPGMECYLQHLPGFELIKYCRSKEDEDCGMDNIAEGDRVCICVGREKLEQLQKSRSGWVAGMSEYIGKTGKVLGFAPNGDVIVVFGSKKYRLFPRALKKVLKIAVGDRVRILDDKEKFHVLQHGHGGCNVAKHSTLGKVGEVIKVLEGEDLVITFNGYQERYNPACCTLAPGVQLDSITISHGDNNSGISLSSGSNFENFLETSLHAFLKALINHDEKSAIEILKNDPKVATAQMQGETSLHFAARCGLLSIAQALVAAGVNINEQNNDGNTPLHLSMSSAKVAEFLIQQGCDVTITNKTGQSACHFSAAEGCTPTLNLLLSKGADFNIQDSNGDTPLHNAIFNSQIAAAEVIISWPQLDIHRTNKEGFAPLHYAAFKGQSAITKLLLKRDKTIVDKQRDDGCTALHVCAAEDHCEVMKVLTEEGGAKVDKKNSKSQTSLHLACQKCNLNCVQLLIEKGADTNSKDDKGNAPLHLAILAAPKENEFMLMALLGQSPKKKEDQCIQITHLLLQNGADITIHNDDGATPLDLCKNDRIKTAVERLIRVQKVKVKSAVHPINVPSAWKRNQIFCFGHDVIEWFAGAVAATCTYVTSAVFPLKKCLIKMGRMLIMPRNFMNISRKS